jgi:hypothetical protein
LGTLFGFVQFDFAGTLPLADGRYLLRDEDGEMVLVVRTVGAPRAEGRQRRRRRAREVEPGAEASPLPLVRVTAIRAFAPFEEEDEARRWLEEATEADETVEVLVGEGIGLLNHALHVRAVAGADPHANQLPPEQAVAVRLGYGSGEETAEGEFSAGREIDLRAAASRRRRRQEELAPQERLAAVLGGREGIDVCETLLLRARADLGAGRLRESALQLRIGLEALLVELRGTVSDPGHERDMATLEERRGEAKAIAAAAIEGELSTDQQEAAKELLEVAERILRRRRVLRN